MRVVGKNGKKVLSLVGKSLIIIQYLGLYVVVNLEKKILSN